MRRALTWSGSAFCATTALPTAGTEMVGAAPEAAASAWFEFGFGFGFGFGFEFGFGLGLGLRLGLGRAARRRYGEDIVEGSARRDRAWARYAGDIKEI